MWAHADLTHWDVLGAGMEHPFVLSLLFCVACLSLVQGQVRGVVRRGKEAAVWPFPFGKRTFSWQ